MKLKTRLFVSSLTLASLASCLDLSGEANFDAHVEKDERGNLSGELEVSGGVAFGQGTTQNQGTLVLPDVSMVGLCFRADYRNSDGSLTSGTPVQITGAPISVPPPPAGALAIYTHYNWGNLTIPRGQGTTVSGVGHLHRLLIPPVLLDGSLGAENTTVDMIVVAAGPDEAAMRAGLVLDAVESALQGPTVLLPSWAKDVTFSSWRVITGGPNSGGVHLTVGALGTDATSFQLDVNGTANYADLIDVELTESRTWVLFEVDIEPGMLYQAQSGGPPVDNESHFAYSTNRTPDTRETHTIALRLD
jgi:hypothetical protein